MLMKKSNNIDEFINWCHLSALEIKEANLEF